VDETVIGGDKQRNQTEISLSIKQALERFKTEVIDIKAGRTFPGDSLTTDKIWQRGEATRYHFGSDLLSEPVTVQTGNYVRAGGGFKLQSVESSQISIREALNLVTERLELIPEEKNRFAINNEMLRQVESQVSRAGGISIVDAPR
jgi:hypothetical protein